jgi:hypothetical protein
MKSGLLFLLAALLVPKNGTAQIPSIKESEVVQTGSVWEEVVKNLSGSSIVTLHATFHCIEANGMHMIDVNGSSDSLYQYSRDRDIQPGSSFVVHVSGHAQCSGGVDAVNFSDGHSEGDSAAIASIYERRRSIYKGLEVAIPLLDSIATGQSTPQDVISIIERRDKAVSSDMSRSQDDRSGEGWIYDLTLNLLRTQTNFRTPSDFTPQRQPRIEDLARTNNISREQAHAIVIMNKYKEWQAALEGHTTPPAPN